MRIAFATSAPSVSVVGRGPRRLATGAAISAWRSSWKPPRPSWVVSVWPDSSTIGDSWPCAVISAAAALAWPGPPVTMAMPGLPVSRPQASAMCTAAASWRVCTRSMPRVDRGVEQRHDVVAGQREDRRVAGAFQRAHDDVGAAKCLCCSCPYVRSVGRHSQDSACAPAWQSPASSTAEPRTRRR